MGRTCAVSIKLAFKVDMLAWSSWACALTRKLSKIYNLDRAACMLIWEMAKSKMQSKGLT